MCTSCVFHLHYFMACTWGHRILGLQQGADIVESVRLLHTRISPSCLIENQSFCSEWKSEGPIQTDQYWQLARGPGDMEGGTELQESHGLPLTPICRLVLESSDNARVKNMFQGTVEASCLKRSAGLDVALPPMSLVSNSLMCTNMGPYREGNAAKGR